MKKNTLKLLLCCGVASLIAINAYATTYNKDSTNTTIERTKASIEDFKNYTIDKKDQAVEKAKDLMVDLDKKIKNLDDSISDKKNDMSDAIRESKRKTLVTLRKQRQDVQNWYDKFKDSTKDAWEEVKNGFVKAYDAFQDTYSK